MIINHTYSENKTYNVTLTVTDDEDRQGNCSEHFRINNIAPNTPNNPNPSNGSTNVDINADLSWNCSDLDGDNLTFDVYFEANDPTPDYLVSNNQSINIYEPEEMEYGTNYYWRIVAWDEFSLSTSGPVWNFKTTNDPNNPPYVPSNPDPENGSIDVDLNVDLSWIGGDPDENDTVVYDVFFEADDPTPDIKVADDINITMFNPGILEYETKYFWQIIAKDNHGASTWGSIWHFTTEPEPIEPIPDLLCEGSLSWSDVNPGSTVTGNFYVENVGDKFSLLNWKIYDIPKWGNWTFDPESGEGLTPEDGKILVNVSVVVPDEFNSEFTGVVKVVNLENISGDRCLIDVYLKTPKNKMMMHSPFWLKLLERFQYYKNFYSL
jgi:hypothetical protein